MTRPPSILLAIADDESREAVGAALTGHGYIVAPARDGGEAWIAYQQQHARVVILDLRLGRIMAADVCRRIRAADVARESYVIAWADPEATEQLGSLLDAGADDYLAAPVTMARLRARLTIAERRLSASEEHRRAEAELARAQWHAEIGELTIALQHEINNPLSALISHAELVLLDAADRGEQHEAIETILQQARRVADAVQRIGALTDPLARPSSSIRAANRGDYGGPADAGGARGVGGAPSDARKTPS